jgi:hypothetical protein
MPFGRWPGGVPSAPGVRTIRTLAWARAGYREAFRIAEGGSNSRQHANQGICIKNDNLSRWPAPGLPSLVLLSNLADLLDQLS